MAIEFPPDGREAPYRCAWALSHLVGIFAVAPFSAAERKRKSRSESRPERAPRICCGTFWGRAVIAILAQTYKATSSDPVKALIED